MQIIQIPTEGFIANCYLVYSINTREGFIVDPGDDISVIKEALEKNAIELKYIVLTHGHGDHLSGVKALKNQYEIPLYIHRDDVDMIGDSELNLSKIMPFGRIELIADKFLKDGDILNIGTEIVTIVHTPGHTKGGICLYFDNKLITGDTLFESSIGRTDLYGGDLQQLKKSIKSKLFKLSDDTVVYPGHGETTTIGKEKSRNIYLR